jgi:hypothetical protein
VLIPGPPLGITTIGVQALAGVLLPSATVFLLVLSNDHSVLGPWTNPRWLNAIASVVVAALIVLSGLLTLTTLFPDLDVAMAATGLSAIAVAVLSVLASTSRHNEPRPVFTGTAWERATWTTPALETLPPPKLSQSRRVGLVVLRVYLAVAALLAVIRVVQVMLGG